MSEIEPNEEHRFGDILVYKAHDHYGRVMSPTQWRLSDGADLHLDVGDAEQLVEELTRALDWISRKETERTKRK